MYLQFLKDHQSNQTGLWVYGLSTWQSKRTRIQYTYYQNQFQVEKILRFPGVTYTGIFTSTSENF